MIHPYATGVLNPSAYIFNNQTIRSINTILTTNNYASFHFTTITFDSFLTDKSHIAV